MSFNYKNNRNIPGGKGSSSDLVLELSTERLLEYLINDEEPPLDKVLATRTDSGRLRLADKRKREVQNRD